MSNAARHSCVWPDIQQALAAAYGGAALAGANMRAATEAFEAIRDAHASGCDIFTMRATLLEQIGRADVETIVPVLSSLRESFERITTAAIVKDLGKAFGKDPASAWSTWLVQYAHCFDERAWWRTLALEMARQALPQTPVPEWPPDKVVAATEAALRGNWPATIDWFLFLAKQDLSPAQRATMLTVAAEIEMYHFVRPRLALAYLEEATGLAPELPSVRRVWGSYWLLMENVEKAQAEYEQVLRLRPDLADGFVGLGDCADKRKDGSVAERYYTQAIANAPGMYDGFLALMRWYGKPENFASGESALGSLFQRAVALAEYKPLAHTELAWLYHGAQRFDDARNAFRAARELDRGYLTPTVGLGYCDLDQARPIEDESSRQERLTSARAYFSDAVQDAPTILDGYWGLSLLAEFEGKIAEALEWCERAAGCPRDWEPTLRVRMADLKSKLDRLDEAEADLVAALSLERGLASAVAEVFELAAAQETARNRDAAWRLFHTWREAKGPEGEGTFHNRLGNLLFTDGDYAAAAARYRLAIAALPRDAVVHSNLALALEKLREPGRRRTTLEEAAAALRVALEIDPENAEYARRLAEVEVERRFVTAYGEPALSYEPFIVPIRVDIREELFPDLLNDARNELSEHTLRLCEEMRNEMRQRRGIVIPGVRFFSDDTLTSGNYRILIMERTEYPGYAEPGASFAPDSRPSDRALAAVSAPAGEWRPGTDASPSDHPGDTWSCATYIVRHVASAVEAHLDQFIGVEEAATLARDGGWEPEQIAEAPLEVARFAGVLKALARSHVPLTDAQTLVREFRRMRSDGDDAPRILDALIRRPDAGGRASARA